MDQQSIIYRFLLAPQFRLWRYLALVLFFTIVSLNQAIVGYKKFIPLMGNSIYWIVAGTILFYMVTVFWILKIVLKYLLSGRYLLFVICIIICSLMYIAISNVTYDSYISDYDFFSKSIMIDNLSAFVVYILCIPGIIIPFFLRNWLVSNAHLNQLKMKQEMSRVEQFKEQINPPSFFKILNSSKNAVKTQPDKASAMLMKLSQLLRYQLYDCNRKQVLLTAEISFLRNFLELEKLYSPKFDYNIEIRASINGIFVFPSVLLPYVQCVMNALDSEADLHLIHIQLDNTDNTIGVTLITSNISNNILLQKELLKVRERLSALYKGCYRLEVANDKLAEVMKIELQLDKQ